MSILRVKLRLFCLSAFSLLVATVLVLTTIPQVFAQEEGDANMTAEDKEALNNNWPQWDTYNPYSLACTEQGARDSALKGDDNIEKAFFYFVGSSKLKLSGPQAAGILGNLMQESHVNPALHQNNSSTSTHPIDGTGFGIAQWTFTSRQAPLVALAASRNVLPNTLAVQLDYISQELEGTQKEALEDLRKQTSAADSARSFHRTYEKSADGASGIQERVDDAEAVLAKYGAKVQGTAPGTFDTTACGGSNILVGEYSFPLAPSTKRNYGYTLPCQNPKTSGPHTTNGVYTDVNGKSTALRTCHHDATPAFDLSYGDVGRKPIYAITSGRISRVNYRSIHDDEEWGRACHSINLKADIASDKSYYWYGHVISTRSAGPVAAGDVIGYVAPYEYGPKCWQGGVHVHIDRGCIKGGRDGDLTSGIPAEGGRKSCREPGFVNDLVKIWEALPAQ